jgi:hypothetical protein
MVVKKRKTMSFHVSSPSARRLLSLVRRTNDEVAHVVIPECIQRISGAKDSTMHCQHRHGFSAPAHQLFFSEVADATKRLHSPNGIATPVIRMGPRVREFRVPRQLPQKRNRTRCKRAGVRVGKSPTWRTRTHACPRTVTVRVLPGQRR